MSVQKHQSVRSSTVRQFGRGAAFTALSLVAAISVASPLAASTASRVAAARPATAGALTAATPVAPLLRAARVSQSRALWYLETGDYVKAATALRNFRVKVAEAHRAGMAPLGPVRALTVLNFEHQAVLSFRAPFNGLTSAPAIDALHTALSSMLANRKAMVDAVVAAPQEEGADYDDVMADTVVTYGNEVRAYAGALANFQLTPQARTALTQDSDRVHDTWQAVARRFGGGE